MGQIDSIKNISGSEIIFDTFILPIDTEMKLITIIDNSNTSGIYWTDITLYNTLGVVNNHYMMTFNDTELNKITEYYSTGGLIFTYNSVEVVPDEGLSTTDIYDLMSTNTITGDSQFNTIEDWGSALNNSVWDYKYIRDRIMELSAVKTNMFVDWDNLNSEEKVIACDFFAVPIAFIVTEAGDSFDSKLDSWIDISKVCRGQRWEYSKKMMFKELPQDGRVILKEITDNKLVTLYIEGIEGTLEDGGVEGLLDYIDSRVGTSFENAGLSEKPYTPSVSADMTEVAYNIIKILKYGIYF